MRTITDTQAQTYANALNARACWAKVEVYSTISSSWIDLTSYLGYNWVKSVSITEGLDTSIATAEVELFLLGGPQGEITSSPFNTSRFFTDQTNNTHAYNGLTYPYRQIRISLAVTPIDVPTSSSDWMLKFRGRITETSVSGYTVKLNCRDEMGDIADAFIENELPYGDDAGSKDVEEVIQDILTDWVTGGVTLWSVTGDGTPAFDPADSPGFAIRRYQQQRQTVMDAIRALADQIGWDLRFRWQSTAADLKLVLSEPERTSPSVLRTFTTADVYTFNASLSLLNVRNYIRVLYTDAGGKRLSAFASDATSITNYGRKFMEIGEEVTSQINTSTEAQDLADRSLSDLALPKVQISCDMSLFPNVELMDYYSFTGDGKISGDYSLAVTGITHRVVNNTGITTLACTGIPSSRKNWSSAQQDFTTKASTYRNDIQLSSGGVNLFGNGSVYSWCGN